MGSDKGEPYRNTIKTSRTDRILTYNLPTPKDLLKTKGAYMIEHNECFYSYENTYNDTKIYLHTLGLYDNNEPNENELNTSDLDSELFTLSKFNSIINY